MFPKFERDRSAQLIYMQLSFYFFYTKRDPNARQASKRPKKLNFNAGNQSPKPKKARNKKAGKRKVRGKN